MIKDIQRRRAEKRAEEAASREFYDRECPPHEHVTVDESAYWSLMYLYIEVHGILKRGDVRGDVIEGEDVQALRHYSEQVDKELAKSRRMNELMPHHHRIPSRRERFAAWRERLIARLRSRQTSGTTV